MQGKAATLAYMAWAAGKNGDKDRERHLNIEAARALASVRAWVDLVTVLGNLGTLEGPDSAAFLAQAVWLSLRVAVPVDEAVATVGALLVKVGPEAESGPLIARAAMFIAQTRGEKHPKREELQEEALAMLGACASARKVEPKKFGEWIESQRLNDPSYFMPALDKALEGMVGEDGWLFDRALVASSAGG